MNNNHASENMPLSIRSKVDNYFSVTTSGSSFGCEIYAGCMTFLALSYIIFVNPAILAKAGISPTVTFIATVLASGLATLAMGLWARLPLVVSTGMEMNAYVAFSVVGSAGFAWQQAIGLVFWASVMMVIVTVFKLRERILDSLPAALQLGLSCSVATFLVLIALSLSGVLRYKGARLDGLGTIVSADTAVFAIGLVIATGLAALRIPGVVLCSISVATVSYYVLGGQVSTGVEAQEFANGFEAIAALDLSVIMQPRTWSILIVLFALDFFGSVAKLVGLTRETKIFQRHWRGNGKRVLLIDGMGSAGAALLGTTSLVVFVESAVGISAGARTGLAAVVTGCLLLASIVAAPVMALVPVIATTGALVFVGVSIFPALKEIRSMPLIDRLTLLAMPAVTVLTFSLDKAVLTGFLIAVSADLFNKRLPSPYLAGSAALLLLTIRSQGF